MVSKFPISCFVVLVVMVKVIVFVMVVVVVVGFSPLLIADPNLVVMQNLVDKLG